ncbi:MAG TPA: UvrD-helicase domain-containing protein, partial [Phycisphaerae bacterium]|nr:UvrD-helicase domain-containing protein [Phycisphaerae bacterium]
QLAFLDTARISTIHSFCRDVLNRYFAQAGLDPQAPILDPHEAAIIRHEAIRKIFDERAAQPGDSGEQFLSFLAAYGMKEEHLQKTILGVDDFLTSIIDPHAWLADSLERSRVAGESQLPPFWHDELRQFLKAELAAHLQAVHQEIVAFERHYGRHEEIRELAAPFLKCLTDYAGALEHWMARLNREPDGWSIDAIFKEEIAAYDFPACPRRNSKTYNTLSRPCQIFLDDGQQTVRAIRDKLLIPLQKKWSIFDTAVWAAGIRQIAPHLAVLVDVLLDLRTAYQNEKRALGVIDFADLERMTLNLLRDESNGVATRLRGEFRHVLVDEFQDVNPIQAEILRLVSREADSARAENLFTVGDVKQSIYRFRLAEPRLFLERQQRFQNSIDAQPAPGMPRTSARTIPIQTTFAFENDPPAGIAIDLLKNFRSTPRVLDAINAVFEKLMAADLGGIAYDDHARLVPGKHESNFPEASNSDAALELHVLDQKLERPEGESHRAESGKSAEDVEDPTDWERIEREAYVIAARIKELVAAGRRFGDIAILLRSMKARIHLFARTLSRLGIPVFAETSGGLFDTLEIRQILALLAVLDNAQQDIPLAATLRSTLIGHPVTDTELAQLRIDAGTGGRFIPFHAAVERYPSAGPDPVLRKKIRSALDVLDDWRQRIRRRPLADVLWEIYEESGYLAYVCGLRDGEQRRANLVQLHEHARKFGEFQRQGLHRFLQYLDGVREAGEDLDAGALSPSGRDVVRIMTIHRSKGLEFPVVIVGELGKRFNLDDAKGAILYDRRLGLALEAVELEKRVIYPTLPHRLVAQANRSEMLAEELRVLYVALTRAKEKLILVGTGSAEWMNGSDHPAPGPLTLMRRRSAATALDWIAAALQAQPREKFQPASPGVAPLFDFRIYDRDEILTWQIDPPDSSDVDHRLRSLAAMLPLDRADSPLPPADLTLRIVERRLTTPYPDAALSRIPGVVAASALKRRWNTLADEDEPAASLQSISRQRPESKTGNVQIADTATLRTPVFAALAAAPASTDLGTWTHEFLQRLDLRRVCDLEDLRSQLMDLTTGAAVFTPEQANGIDLDAVAWFFTTDLGGRLRDPRTRVLREWPFVIGVDPRKYDPMAAAGPDEVLLVRGIIDCLFDAGNGWEILDYKTDRITGGAVAARSELYKGQLDIYAAAIEAVWKIRPRVHWLAFLNPREIVQP